MSSSSDDDENDDIAPCFKSINSLEEADSVRVVDFQANGVPLSPSVTPFALAVLSPKSKAKNQRRLDRYAQSDKVAIAFNIDDDEWTDGKSKAKSDSSGSRIGAKLFQSLTSSSQNDESGDIIDGSSTPPSSKIFLKLLTLVLAVSCGIALMTSFASTRSDHRSDGGHGHDDIQDVYHQPSLSLNLDSSKLSGDIFAFEQEPAPSAQVNLELEPVLTPLSLSLDNVDSFVANKAAAVFSRGNKVAAVSAVRAGAGVEVGSLFVHTNDHFAVSVSLESASHKLQRVHVTPGQGLNPSQESWETELVVHQTPTAKFQDHSNSGKIRRRTGLAARATAATGTATARMKRHVQGQDARKEMNPTFAIVRLQDTKQLLESETEIYLESAVAQERDLERRRVEGIVEDMRMQILQVADWDALERRQQLESRISEAAAAPQLALHVMQTSLSSAAAALETATAATTQLSLHGATSLFPPPIFAFTESRLLAPATLRETADIGADAQVKELQLNVESGLGLQVFARNSFDSSGKPLFSSLLHCKLVSAEWSTMPVAAASEPPLQGPLPLQWYKGCSIVLSLSPHVRAPEVKVNSRQQETGEQKRSPLAASLLDVRWAPSSQGNADAMKGVFAFERTRDHAVRMFTEDGLQ